MTTQRAETNRVTSLGENDLGTVIEDTGVTLVEFYTEWCGTCQRLKPVLGALAEDTDATVVTVDIESHLETAIEFGAQSTPTFVLFADGQPVKQLRGGQDEQTLRALVDRYSD
ncbi:thioredoxin family protein [Salarchaeum japonicum]|uniref:Thioredoxin n=1 Tax=Salarchaeum japonicum TaxID=555573 RepID=A0AAV3T433_9EURY|nr:thioredoxin family protein [Salarchaeum japonicum]